MRTRKQNKKILIMCILIAILSINGCTGSEYLASNPGFGIQDYGLYWPPPPQTPKIKYLRSITNPSDIGIKKSFWRKAVDSVFGADNLPENLLRPYGVYANSDRIYVTDPGLHVVHIFDLNHNKYFNLTSAKEDDLVSPIGIAADENGEIYLTDSVLKKVIVYDKYGKYEREIGSPGSFIRPAGLAPDHERLYVVDTHAQHVLVFDKKEGKFLFSFGQNGFHTGEFNYPTNISAGKDKLLYISDSMNFRVQIFDREGHYISSFGKSGDGTGDFSKPKGIAVDSDGHIYVVDAQFDTVQIFEKDGTFLLNFGGTGTGPGGMFLPAGIYIDDQDRIYVADSYNNRIQVFQYLKEKS